MNTEALIGAQVELSAPDGRIFRFRVCSLVPYAGETYAVLEEEKQDGQLLVTHVEEGPEGIPLFVVAGEEDIISAVLEKQVAQTIARALDKLEDIEDASPDEPADDPLPNSPGHTLLSNGRCSCGRFHKSFPAYIRRANHEA